MSRGNELCSPLVILNMGGEMIYILDQRLRAQQIESTKAIKVLNDVTKALFSDDFIIKLFEPQKICSLAFSKHLFEKVVHCSIMKLNETSMSKLFDLMTMGFKQQLIASKTPHDIYHITLNHLNGINFILKEGDSVKFVNKVKGLFIEKFAKLGIIEYLHIRGELLKYLQDRIIRVSVFLQDNIQNNDGSIVISNRGIGGVFIQQPGIIINYKPSGKVQCSIEIKSSRDFVVNTSNSYLENKTVILGNNIYSQEKPSSDQQKAETQISNISQANQETTNLFKTLKISNEATTNDEDLKKNLNINPIAAKNELNLLASLIKGTEKTKNEPTLKLNLFPDRKKKDSGAMGVDDDNDIIILDAVQESKKLKNEVDKLFDDLKPNPQNQQPKDLLELMLENDEEFKE